jgi:bacterioferritin (cytochrome b1)
MDASKTTITNLQSSAQRLASLADQFQLDARWVKAMGVKWLAHHIDKWHEQAERHSQIFIDRLFYIELAVSYQPDEVSAPSLNNGTVEAVLLSEQKLVASALDAFMGYRKAAWDEQADYTPDLYEHAIECLEKQSVKLARDLRLLGKLTEPGYIGARLEDE